MSTTFKVVPAGNGDLYTYAKYEKGERVLEDGVNYPTFHSEADAEKYIRTIATKNDVVEVSDIKNVNTDANTNVHLVLDEQAINDRYHGMKPVASDESVEGKVEAEQREEIDANAAKAEERYAKSTKGEEKEVPFNPATAQAVKDVRYPLPQQSREEVESQVKKESKKTK